MLVLSLAQEAADPWFSRR